MSRRARKTALEREGRKLFPAGFWEESSARPSEREQDLQQASRLRGLAGRGMSTRKYRKEANRLEAKWNGATP